MARLNLPPLTRAFVATLVLLTLLNAALQPTPFALSWFVRTGHGSPFFSLVPGQSFRFPWTLVTAAFVEQNIFGLVGTGLTLFFGGRYLERAWGAFELAKFILLACALPNALCFALYIVLYGASGSNRAL
jgi:membrane associated rhomboid family serine protease